MRGLEIGRRSFGPRGTAAFIVRAGESMIRKKAEQEWGDFERDAASRFSNAIALRNGPWQKRFFRAPVIIFCTLRLV